MKFRVPDLCRVMALFQLILASMNLIVAATEIYMSDYGICNGNSIIPVDGDSFLVYSGGGEKGYAYSNSLCSIRFETKRDDRLCLIFKRFSVKDCGVRLKVFHGNSPTGTVAGEYSCRDSPQSACSANRYLTLQLMKDTTRNVDYEFELEVRERTYSDAFTEGIDAFILSIGVIIAIIVGVLIVVTVLAVIVVYCCCKRQRVAGRISRHGPKTSSTFISSTRLEPSAPPLLNDAGRSHPENALPPYISPEQEPLSGFYPIELPPAYSSSPPPYQETANTELNHTRET